MIQEQILLVGFEPPDIRILPCLICAHMGCVFTHTHSFLQMLSRACSVPSTLPNAVRTSAWFLPFRS